MLLYKEHTIVCLGLIIVALSKPVTADSDGAYLRGFSHDGFQSHRILPPHPHSSGGGGGGGGGSDYNGCLDLDTTEQEEIWPDGPSCEYGEDSESDDDTVTEYEETNDDTTTNPYDDFVISDCKTYESLWRWDLHMSCGGDSANHDSCSCTFAEELFDLGLLVCEDRARCPRSCPICSTCLSILGCPDAAGSGSRLETSTLIYIIVGAVILLVVGLALYHSHRRKQQQTGLNQQLLSDADAKGGVDPSHYGESRFIPPNVDAGNAQGITAAGVIGGGIVGGAVSKPSKDIDSDDETDDYGDSVDETVPTAAESAVDVSVGAAGLVIPTVRSEEEDAVSDEDVEPMVEPSDTDVADTAVESSNLSKGNGAAEDGMAPTESASIGAVRSAFLHSLGDGSADRNGTDDNQEMDASTVGILGEEGNPETVSGGSQESQATPGSPDDETIGEFEDYESIDTPGLEEATQDEIFDEEVDDTTEGEDAAEAEGSCEEEDVAEGEDIPEEEETLGEEDIFEEVEAVEEDSVERTNSDPEPFDEESD